MQNSPDGNGWKLALAAFCGSLTNIQGILEMPCISGTVREKMKGILEMPSINGQRDFPLRRSISLSLPEK